MDKLMLSSTISLILYGLNHYTTMSRIRNSWNCISVEKTYKLQWNEDESLVLCNWKSHLSTRAFRSMTVTVDGMGAQINCVGQSMLSNVVWSESERILILSNVWSIFDFDEVWVELSNRYLSRLYERSSHGDRCDRLRKEKIPVYLEEIYNLQYLTCWS